jgi:hypothetical protein
MTFANMDGCIVGAWMSEAKSGMGHAAVIGRPGFRAGALIRGTGSP